MNDYSCTIHVRNGLFISRDNAWMITAVQLMVSQFVKEPKPKQQQKQDRLFWIGLLKIFQAAYINIIIKKELDL